jgi:hypothetical protein
MTDEYGRIHTDGSRSGGQPVDDIEQKVLALLNEIKVERGKLIYYDVINRNHDVVHEALCRAVEQREILNAENQQLRYDLERQMTIANEHVNEVEELRKPKTVTVTVVSAYDRKAMNTFKINPAEKTYVRPDHSMFGYVFEPEE